MKPHKPTAADVREIAREALGYRCLLAHDLLESWLRTPGGTQATAEAGWLSHVPKRAATGGHRKRAGRAAAPA
jgi:hypothetical protein